MVTRTKHGIQYGCQNKACHQIRLPGKNMVIKYGYKKKTWSSNVVAGTKLVHQMWLPEQNMASNMVNNLFGLVFSLKLSGHHQAAMRYFL